MAGLTRFVPLTGYGHVDRDAVLFTVTVSDNGNPGFSDTFSINITGARTSSRSGTLSNGNIQFHR